MASWPDLGLDIPFVKELATVLVGVPTFAYGCYRYGRRVGNRFDKARIKELIGKVEAAGEQATGATLEAA
jgi:hypothetical protein